MEAPEGWISNVGAHDVCSAEVRPISGFQQVDWQPADELAGPYAVW